MKLLEQAQAILGQIPLPDDAPQQIEALERKATGLERKFITMSSSALFTCATQEQIEKWNPEQEQN